MDIKWNKTEIHPLCFCFEQDFMWKWMNEKQTIYTARSQLDNRDIRITCGRITEVQLYCMKLFGIMYYSHDFDDITPHSSVFLSSRTIHRNFSASQGCNPGQQFWFGRGDTKTLGADSWCVFQKMWACCSCVLSCLVSYRKLV